MDQVTLLRELYRACLERDVDRQRELLREELEKVLERRLEGRAFDASWTVVRG